jgi:hypothetical protein
VKSNRKKNVLTAAQIHARYDSEWILVGDPETDESLEVTRGRVLCHSKDRDEVYRKAVQIGRRKARRRRRFAILYTGKMPKGTAVIL